MTIHNGNSDFNLSVKQNGKLNLEISFTNKSSYSGIGANPIKLVVYRPTDGNQVYSRDFTSLSEGEDVTVQVPVDVYGEHKVQISSSRGQSYDYTFEFVVLTSYGTESHVYTAQDVRDYKIEKTVVTLAFAAIGLSSKVAIALSATVLSTSMALTDIWTYDAEGESLPAPIEGYTLKVTNRPGNRGFYTTMQVYDRNNNPYLSSVETYTPFLAWRW